MNIVYRRKIKNRKKKKKIEIGLSKTETSHCGLP